jgi:hypothetical protein
MYTCYIQEESISLNEEEQIHVATRSYRGILIYQKEQIIASMQSAAKHQILR